MTTMTTYQVVLNHGTVTIEAETYRTPVPVDDSLHRELYFYDDSENEGEPVATFPAGQWDAVFEADRGNFIPQ